VNDLRFLLAFLILACLTTSEEHVFGYIIPVVRFFLLACFSSSRAFSSLCEVTQPGHRCRDRTTLPAQERDPNLNKYKD
jgi:hypothetical protein